MPFFIDFDESDTDGRTDGRTDGPTDGQANRRTDKTSYRDGRMINYILMLLRTIEII